MKRSVLLCLVLFATINSRSASVDTITIYSNAMHQSFKCVVISPDTDKSKALPVVYLLHGHAGWYSNWIIRVPQLKDLADQYQTMIVCPEGGYSSWYLDSPVDSTMRYETYVGREVPDYIDAHYNTIKDRSGRAITGLSMGGHGGLFLGLRHADFFGACGSMSGGVDLNTMHTKFDVMKRVGDTILYAKNWDDYSVINLVEHYPKDTLAIIFDIGTEDFFYGPNHALHEKMVKLKIPHDYTERPGKHDWAYWRNSIQYQMLFFRNYFDRRKL